MVQSRVGLSGLLRGILVFALAIIALAGVNTAQAQSVETETISCSGGPSLAGTGGSGDFGAFIVDLSARTCAHDPSKFTDDVLAADRVHIGHGGSWGSTPGLFPMRITQKLFRPDEHTYSCTPPTIDLLADESTDGLCYFSVDSSLSEEVGALVQLRDKTTGLLHAEFEAVIEVVPGATGNRTEVTIPDGVTFYTYLPVPEVTELGFLGATSAQPGENFSLSVMFDQAMDATSAPTLQFYDGVDGEGSAIDLSAWRTGGNWFSNDTLYSASFTAPDPLTASAAIRSVIVSDIDSATDLALVDHTENISFTVLQNILPNVSVDPLLTTDTTPPLSGTIDDPSASVSITVNGQTVSAQNDGVGGWTVADNVLDALPFNTYDVVASATDMNGLVGADTTAGELVIAAIVAPEIEVVSSISGAFLTGSEDAVVGAVEGVEQSLTYTVTNTGNIDLNLDAMVASGLINISGAIDTGAGANANTLLPGASQAIAIKFTPASAGDFSFSLSLANDDPDESLFEIDIAGTAVAAAPELQIISTSGEILGADEYETLNGLVFGENARIRYAFKNVGNAGLRITGISGLAVTFINVGNSTLSALTGAVIAPGESLDYYVDFTPRAAGSFRLGVLLSSNSVTQNNVAFGLEGVAGAPPEIEVSSSVSGALTDGDTDNLGNSTVGAATSVTYTIDNSAGTGPLVISDVTASTPTNLLNDTVAFNETSFNIPAGDSDTLTATFTSFAAGAFGFELDIDSNDADETPFDITVSGTAVSGPEISVAAGSPSTDFTSGGTDAPFTDPTAGVELTRVYTLSNIGNETLTISSIEASTLVNIPDGVTFDRTMFPLTLAPMANLDVTATFTPQQPLPRSSPKPFPSR
ncbi:MAG: choice-of-anchor D domain-containing protein [Henriciella sp.]